MNSKGRKTREKVEPGREGSGLTIYGKANGCAGSENMRKRIALDDRSGRTRQ